MKTQPKVIIPKDIYDKVMHWVFKAGGREISGLGKCEYDAETNTFKVVDAAVLKQSIQTSGNTEFTAEAAGKYMYDSREIGTHIWWWHSHHSMGAFWSSTDTDCISSFAKQGLVVATVFNNKYEHLTCVSFNTKVKSQVSSIFGDQIIDEEREVTFDKIKAEVLSYYPNEEFERWSKEYEEAALTQQYNHRYPTDKPNPTIVKRWEAIPGIDLTKFLFEDPRKTVRTDWVYSGTEWVEAGPEDYRSKYLLEHPAWKSYEDSKAEQAKQITLLSGKASVDEARKLMGISESEWASFDTEEKDWYLERYDQYSTYLSGY